MGPGYPVKRKGSGDGASKDTGKDAKKCQVFLNKGMHEQGWREQMGGMESEGNEIEGEALAGEQDQQ